MLAGQPILMVAMAMVIVAKAVSARLGKLVPMARVPAILQQLLTMGLAVHHRQLVLSAAVVARILIPAVEHVAAQLVRHAKVEPALVFLLKFGITSPAKHQPPVLLSDIVAALPQMVLVET